MTEREQRHHWMRLVQHAVDVAAVARARYRKRVEQEEGPPVGERRQFPAGGAATAPPARPAGSAPEHPNEKHEESREKIGDPSASPAPPAPTSLPEPCRHHVVPHGAWPTLKELFRRFGQDQCPAFAAALAFFSILSIVPILLVAVAALAFVLHDPHQAMLHIQSLVGRMLPGSTAQRGAQSILAQASVEKSVQTMIQTRGIAGIIGILSLLWASIQIFVNGAPAMNAAYEVEETRGWVKLRLMAMGLLVGAGVLFLLSFLPSSGPAFVRNLHLPWLGLPKHVPWYIDVLFWLVALAINVTMFALIYKYLPNAPTTWREAFAGGLVAGVLWELAKRGFALYLAHFNSYDKVYGTLGSMIILVLWIYYTSMILLLGAEAASLYQDIHAAARESGREPAPARRASAARQRARA